MPKPCKRHAKHHKSILFCRVVDVVVWLAMTSTNTEETLILKTDALGRVHMPADRREAILDAFEQSGMSGQAFAKHAGLKYPTFASLGAKTQT